MHVNQHCAELSSGSHKAHGPNLVWSWHTKFKPAGLCLEMPWEGPSLVEMPRPRALRDAVSTVPSTVDDLASGARVPSPRRGPWELP